MPTTDLTSETGAHYWFGQWMDADALPQALQGLGAHVDATLPRPFPLQALLAACDQLAQQLQARSGCYGALFEEACRTCPAEDAAAMLQAMAAMLARDAMQEKLRSELGSAHPGALQRRYPGRQYEAWAPCGCVVHVAPSNVFTAAAMGLVEGLMAGNVNVVKISARDGRVAALFAAALAAADPTDRIVVFGSFYTVGGVLHEGLPKLNAPHLQA